MKKTYRYLGYIIVGLSIYYLGTTFFNQAKEFKNFNLSSFDVIIIIVLGLAYSLALLLIATAWAAMVSEEKYWNTAAFAAYTKSSILKYLPGNIMHLIGRNFSGHNTKRNHWRMGAATLGEIAFSLLSATFISSIMFMLTSIHISKYLIALAAGISALGVSLIPLLPKVIRTLAHHWPNIFKPERVPQNLGTSFLSILIGFGLITLIAELLGQLFWLTSAPPLYSGGLFVLAWLVGFIVPGAPGGVGVREAFLTAGLSMVVDTHAALTFALVMRAVSTLGDLFVFLVGSTISRHLNKHPDN